MDWAFFVKKINGSLTGNQYGIEEDRMDTSVSPCCVARLRMDFSGVPEMVGSGALTGGLVRDDSARCWTHRVNTLYRNCTNYGG